MAGVATWVPRGPTPFALSTPAALERMVRAAGFVEVRSEPFTVTFEFPSVDGLRTYLGDVSAPVRAILAARGPEWRAEFWERLAIAAHAYVDADGTIRLPSD